jgi:hypothetical protein
MRRSIASVVAAVSCSAAAGQVSFTNVSAQAGLTGGVWPPAGVRGGLAVDVNEDGWVDLYFPINVYFNVDRFFLNDGDGTYTEQFGAWGAVDIQRTESSLMFDQDGDGKLDLILANVAPSGDASLRVLRQDAAAPLFNDVTATSGLDFVLPGPGVPTGMAAVDLDGDDDLDLALGSWWGNDIGTSSIDLLCQNEGAGTFHEAGAAGGLEPGSRTWQYHAADFDLDGAVDLFASQDSFDHSRLYRNIGPWSLDDVGLASGVTGLAPDMGIAVGDYDNDGDFDVYVTDITISVPACNTQQPAGLNRLFRNELVPSGTLGFTEVANTAGVANVGYSWGCVWLDYDNDGDLDLAAASQDCESRLFRNDGAGGFQSVGASLGFSPSVSGGGLVALDHDRDGDLDLLLVDSHGPPLLYRNDGGNLNNWIVVKPVGKPGAAHGVGAKVWLDDGVRNQLRQITAGSSFLSQEPLEAHFGLGQVGVVPSILVEWPDGAVTQLTDVAANQIVEARHPDAPTPVVCHGDLNGDGATDVFDFSSLAAAFGAGPGDTHWDPAADLVPDGSIDVFDFSALAADFGCAGD